MGIKQAAIVSFLILGSPFVFAASGVDPVDCDVMGNRLVGTANMSGLGGFDPVITVKNGKPVLNTDSNRIISRESNGNHTSVKFRRQAFSLSGEMLDVEEKVDFTLNEAGYVVQYKYDPKGDIKLMQGGVQAQKARVIRDDRGHCEIDQFSNLMSTGTETPLEIVVRDRKFCESVKDIMTTMGKSSFDQCHDLLKKASNAYQARAQQLLYEQKQFSESGVNNSMLVVLTSLNNCGPEEWYEVMDMGAGPRRILKAGTVPASSGKPGQKTQMQK